MGFRVGLGCIACRLWIVSYSALIWLLACEVGKGNIPVVTKNMNKTNSRLTKQKHGSARSVHSSVVHEAHAGEKVRDKQTEQIWSARAKT